MSQPQPWPFLKKRILRIYPAFIIASLLSEYVFGPMGHNPNYWATYSRDGSFYGGSIFYWATRRAKRMLPISLSTRLTVLASGRFVHQFICYLGVMVMGLLGLFRHRRAVLLIWLAFFAYFCDSDHDRVEYDHRIHGKNIRYSLGHVFAHSLLYVSGRSLPLSVRGPNSLQQEGRHNLPDCINSVHVSSTRRVQLPRRCSGPISYSPAGVCPGSVAAELRKGCRHLLTVSIYMDG